MIKRKTQKWEEGRGKGSYEYLKRKKVGTYAIRLTAASSSTKNRKKLLLLLLLN